MAGRGKSGFHSKERHNTVILRKALAGLNERALTRFAARAQQAIGLRGEVNILVAGNDEMQALNARFRGKHQPTDVLSFPAMSGAGSLTGDLAISADLAAVNAKRLGHAAADEVKILIVHGLLHLAGYDHEQDQGEMARRETHLRRLLRLPGGLIERHQLQDTAKPGALSVTLRGALLKGRRRPRPGPGAARRKTR